MVVDSYALLLRFGDLKGVGQHFLAILDHQALDFLGSPQADGRPSHVQGDFKVAA